MKTDDPVETLEVSSEPTGMETIDLDDGDEGYVETSTDEDDSRGDESNSSGNVYDEDDDRDANMENFHVHKVWISASVDWIIERIDWIGNKFAVAWSRHNKKDAQSFFICQTQFFLQGSNFVCSGTMILSNGCLNGFIADVNFPYHIN